MCLLRLLVFVGDTSEGRNEKTKLSQQVCANSEGDIQVKYDYSE